MFGEILSGIAGVAGAVGSIKGNKQKAQAVNGFETLPQEVKDAYLQTFLPDALENYNRPYQAPITRRYVETDPIFQSAALSDFQRYSDQNGGLFSPIVAKVAPQADVGGGDAAYAMQMADMAAKGGTKSGSSLWEHFRKNATPEQMAAVGKQLAGAQYVRGGPMAGGFINPKTGKAVSVTQLLLGVG